MCSTCWSVGIGIARAVSIARSTSVCVTSLSLIATIPVELKLLMWLPAIPVKTRSILQSAISSASSSVRWIAFTVVSMFTTTPFFRPLDSWPPMPTMSMRPSGNSSATTATTFEVPMSSATMRFLLSLAMSDSLVPAGLGARNFGRMHREAVRVAQVDVIDPLPRPCERLRERRDEACEAVLDAIAVGVATQMQRDSVRQPQLPGEARGEQHLRRRESERRERIPEREVAPRDLGLAAGRPGEDRKRGIALPAEQLPLRAHQLRVPALLAPARDRDLLLDAHLEAVGPAAPQLDAAHPGNALEEGAHRLQVDGEERSRDAPLERGHDVAARDAVEVAADDDRLQQERRRFDQNAPARVGEQGKRERGERAGGGVDHARAIPHAGLLSPAAPTRGCAGTGPRTTARRGAPPWARASDRSCPGRC